MPRLIDADVLHRELVVEMVKCVRMNEETKMTMAERVLNKLDDAPTIDPESLRPHGRWVNVRMLVGGFAEQWGADCPNCRKTSKEPLGNYCSNCGWRLDLEE